LNSFIFVTEEQVVFCEVWIDIILVSLERPKIHVTLKKGTVFLGIFQEN